MIDYIKGTVAEISTDAVVVENRGIGYLIKIPSSVAKSLPKVGEKTKIYTYMYVREDIIALYGFLAKSDLQMFLSLLSVSGIGPKAALAILSVMTVSELTAAILSDDAKAIAKAPGVGNKTAQRVIVELKDKLDLESIQSDILVSEITQGENSNIQEACQALMSLGYGNAESQKAVSMVEGRETMTTEDILKQALKQFLV